MYPFHPVLFDSADLRKMTYSELNTVNENDYSIFKPINFPIIKDSWKPISIKENELLKTLTRLVIEKKLVTVEEVFNVQQGIRQGAKDIFKISKTVLENLPKEEQKYFRVVVDNDSIKNGVLKTESYIWYPYNAKGILFSDEEDLKSKTFQFYSDFLKPNEKILKSRAGITEWWGLTRPRNWQFEKKPKLVSTEFGRSDSFAFDKKGAFVVERGNAWIPKEEFDESDYYFYLSVFSSPFFDKLLSIFSKQLAGGNWYDLGKMYTSQIPIPNIQHQSIRNSEAYQKLVEIGKEISNGNTYLKSILHELIAKYFYPISL